MSTCQVLLLHLMRYSFGAERGVASKLHHTVSYPANLRLRPQWTSEDCPERRSASYRLIAMVTHHGRNTSGARSVLSTRCTSLFTDKVKLHQTCPLPPSLALPPTA